MAGSSPAFSAETLRLHLQKADARQSAHELERVLGAAVELRGETTRTVSLDLALPSRARILDRVAAALGGEWHPVLRVRPGAMSMAGRSPDLERFLAIGVQDVPASRAFSTVARELKAELDVEGDLSKRVALVAVNVPAQVILDRLAEQAGVNWSLVYRIEVKEPVRQPVPATTPELPSETPPAVPAVPSSTLSVPVPTAPPVTATSTPEAIRKAVWDAIGRLVRATPDRRGEAVREFITYGEQLFGGWEKLPLPEQQQRQRAAATVLGPWRRLYRGLAPNVQQELAPAREFLEKSLRLR